MQLTVISQENIKKTNAYKKAPQFVKVNTIKKSNIILLQTGLSHYNQTKTFLENIGTRNIRILSEIIEQYKKQHQDDL